MVLAVVLIVVVVMMVMIVQGVVREGSKGVSLVGGVNSVSC